MSLHFTEVLWGCIKTISTRHVNSNSFVFQCLEGWGRWEVLKEIGQAVSSLMARLKYLCQILAGRYLYLCNIYLVVRHWGQICFHPDKIHAIINTYRSSFPLNSSANTTGRRKYSLFLKKPFVPFFSISMTNCCPKGCFSLFYFMSLDIFYFLFLGQC